MGNLYAIWKPTFMKVLDGIFHFLNSGIFLGAKNIIGNGVMVLNTGQGSNIVDHSPEKDINNYFHEKILKIFKENISKQLPDNPIKSNFVIFSIFSSSNLFKFRNKFLMKFRQVWNCEDMAAK